MGDAARLQDRQARTAASGAERLMWIALATLSLLPTPADEPKPSFSQLIATRYTAGAELPSEAAPPARAFDFVDAAKLPADSVLLSAARSAGGSVWVMTDQGPYRSSKSGFVPLEVGPRHPEPGTMPVNPLTRVTAVANDASGHIWVATDRGLYLTDGEQFWVRIDGQDGMPYEVMTCLHLAPNGDVWGGTNEGAWRLRDGQFRYFWGRRWLPDNRVRAIWSGADGSAWIETAAGVARIEERPMTLAEKAAHYDAITQGRHNRRGYICNIDLKVPGDPTGGHVFEVSDNDGLWTAEYVAAMCFRYAATKDPAAREQAKASMNALLDLERLSGIPGFPARAVVTDAELAAGARGFNPEARVHAPGEDIKVWYRPMGGAPDLWCKGDTSSDETDGHYFAWYLYHDLVADEVEKREIEGVVRRVTDWIIENGYTLVDHTGRKTRWGIWAPGLINGHPYYYTLRPLNSLEILAALKIAAHVTGDAKYQAHYDKLVTKHHYLLNALMMRRGPAGRWPDANHSDDNLLYLSYYPLLRLETDPDRRRLLLQSITRTWKDGFAEQSLRPERSPLYNFVYGATTGRPCDVDEAVETLRDWPWELIDWTTKNSHRHDVRVVNEPGVHRQPIQLDEVLPVSERTYSRWNGNPWDPDGGTDGRREFDGVAWSLGYWLGVYHGFIGAGE